jgi:hypothetical protein
MVLYLNLWHHMLYHNVIWYLHHIRFHILYLNLYIYLNHTWYHLWYYICSDITYDILYELTDDIICQSYHDASDGEGCGRESRCWTPPPPFPRCSRCIHFRCQAASIFTLPLLNAQPPTITTPSLPRTSVSLQVNRLRSSLENRLWILGLKVLPIKGIK